MICDACGDNGMCAWRIGVEGNIVECDKFIPLEMKDNVNHPSHYESGNFECIDVMIETQGAEEVKSFCLCNAFKYLYRHKRKNGIEDIKKARWYIDKFIELSEPTPRVE